MPNTWRYKEPYYAWICTSSGCVREGTEWRDQDGGRECPACHRPRIFVGRYAQSHSGKSKRAGRANKRFNLDTEKWEYIRPPTSSTHQPTRGTEFVGVRDTGGNVVG